MAGPGIDDSSAAHVVSSSGQSAVRIGGADADDGHQPRKESDFADPFPQRGPGRPKLKSDEELSAIIVKALLEARRNTTCATDVNAQRSPDWFNFKRGKICGTVATAVRGGPDGILAAVAKMFQLNDDFESDGMAPGLRIERVVETYMQSRADGYAVSEHQAIYVHKDYPWIVYRPDAVIANGSDRVLLEVKNFSTPVKKVPKRVNDQVQLGMWVLGLREAITLVCRNTDFQAPIVLETVHIFADLVWQRNFQAQANAVYTQYLGWFHAADIEEGKRVVTLLLSNNNVGRKQLAALKRQKR